MSDKRIEMSLLMSNKSGVLSSVMKQGTSHGLMYQEHHLEKLDEAQSRIKITFEGSLNCPQDELVDSIESISAIELIEDISINESSVANFSETINKGTPHTILRAHYVITPEALQIAEDRLTAVLGSIAPYMVEKAAKQTKHIGDLFLLLSKELKGEHRDKFLSLVKDLNTE